MGSMGMSSHTCTCACETVGWGIQEREHVRGMVFLPRERAPLAHRRGAPQRGEKTKRARVRTPILRPP